MSDLLSPPKSYKPIEPLETPFYRAKQEWDERIGSSVVQARNWRLAFFCSAVLSVLLASGLILEAKRRQVIPIVVGVDKDRGEPVVIGRVGDDFYKPRIQEIKYFLSQFVVGVRGVPSDPVLIKQTWLKAYKFLRPSAANMLNDLTNNDPNSPLKKIGDETVTVKPISVVQVSDTNSYQARWEETIYSKQGSVKERCLMTGIFTLELDPPQTEDILQVNPLGLYITNFQWNKEL